MRSGLFHHGTLESHVPPWPLLGGTGGTAGWRIVLATGKYSRGGGVPKTPVILNFNVAKRDIIDDLVSGNSLGSIPGTDGQML